MRNRGGDAYELVDELPCGDARSAAWAAYALQTYGDKLLAADPDGYLPGETARVAAAAFRLAAGCLDVARDGGPPSAVPSSLPRWRTPLCSEEQVAGMRDALEALRTYIAYELRGRAVDDAFPQRLAEIDDGLDRIERLWIARDSADIRAGLATSLHTGLDRAYALGRAVTSSPAAPQRG